MSFTTMSPMDSSGEPSLRRNRGSLDTVGACLSLACAIHCIVLPLLITMVPFVGLEFFASEEFERFMVVFTVCLAAVSFIAGFKLHRERKPIFFMSLALLFFVTSHLFEHDVHWLFMGTGAVILAFGHYINRKLCQLCPTCCTRCA